MTGGFVKDVHKAIVNLTEDEQYDMYVKILNIFYDI